MEPFVVTHEKPAQIFIGCSSILMSILSGYVVAASFDESGITGGLIFLVLVTIFFLFIGIDAIISIFSFKVEVEGANIKVKDGKKNYIIMVQDIKKVVLVETVRKYSLLTCEIRTAENTLKISHQYVGFLNMLEYLKRNYDSGIINKKAISSGGYVKLKDFANRCPEYRKRKKQEAKSI